MEFVADLIENRTNLQCSRRSYRDPRRKDFLRLRPDAEKMNFILLKYFSHYA